METKNFFFDKSLLIITYSFFLSLDCYFLYSAKYSSRILSKPILMLILIYWFLKRTSFDKNGILPNSYVIQFYTYAILILSFFSDICALWSDIFVWSVCRFLYIPIYFCYLLLLIEVQKRKTISNTFNFHWKMMASTFVIMLMLTISLLLKIVGFGSEFYHWCLYVHSLIICLLAVVVVNMWGERGGSTWVILFSSSVLFIIITNITFGFDELYYNRRHHILDVFVALTNGAATLQMLFGVLKVLLYSRNE